MGKTLAEKLIDSHIVEGRAQKGAEIGIKIDQTLTQDATGTMVYLAFEAMGLARTKAELSVSYVDHNLLQTDFKNPDDHAFLRTAAARFGVKFSKPGSGICHQVHLERFGAPGKTLLGSDSHTPTGGGLGMLAIGAGGLDVAAAMAGRPFYLTYPRVLGVRLTGALAPWVSGKDIILWLLGELTVKGGVGHVIEFFGPGVSGLDVTTRAAVANMGAELGATSTVWPADEKTREFLALEKRESAFRPLAADNDAAYDRVIELDLSTLEPMIARPSMPDNVVPVRQVAGLPVSQVLIGSCSNSSLRDLSIAALVLQERSIDPSVGFEINPGSSQVIENLIATGRLADLAAAGARIHQAGCLGCIGIGQAPATGAVSLRTFTRNFKGRSGNKDDQVFLCSPETAVAAAVTGRITDPRELGPYPAFTMPEELVIHDTAIFEPPANGAGVKIVRGPNIQPFPVLDPLPERLAAQVTLKVGDNVTTDHIMPAGNQILPLRSNIPAICRFVFNSVDETFCDRAEAAGSAAVIGGENYGQGSSREHAAIAPRYLGVRLKLVKSFARIHKANLINYGVLPLTFADPADYEGLQDGDELVLEKARERVLAGDETLEIRVGDKTITARLDASARERRILAAGGLLSLIRQEG